MNMKICIIDLETGGLDPKFSPILQFAGIILTNNNREEFNLFCKPFHGADISDEALQIHKFTKETIMNDPKFKSEKEVYNILIETFGKHIDKYNPMDKFHMMGFNCRTFDEHFVRELFKRHNDKFYGSYFWPQSIDMLIVWNYLLMEERHNISKMTLENLSEYLQIDVNKNKLHDALYDCKLVEKLWEKTKSLYDKKRDNNIVWCYGSGYGIITEFFDGGFKVTFGDFNRSFTNDGKEIRNGKQSNYKTVFSSPTEALRNIQNEFFR